MTQAKRQVKFECSEQFYKRLMDEKLQRNLTLQQLAVRALERYLAISESAHRELDEVTKRYGYDIQRTVKESLVAVRRQLDGKGPGVDSQQNPEVVEREDLVAAIGALLGHFPLEKLRLTKDLLMLDARHYRRDRKNRSQRAPRTAVKTKKNQ